MGRAVALHKITIASLIELILVEAHQASRHAANLKPRFPLFLDMVPAPTRSPTDTPTPSPTRTPPRCHADGEYLCFM